MEIKEKILCGSTKLFQSITGFKPNDTDYLIISDNSETFEHIHPDEETCYFIWGNDKQMVKKYMLDFPYYLCAMALVTKEFVDYYEFTLAEIERIVNKHRNIYQNSTYRYYIPLFDYIINTRSWDFPEDVIQESYNLYKEFKKR